MQVARFLESGVIDKLVANNIAIDVHQPEKPNPLLRTLGDVALPMLTIAGVAGVVADGKQERISDVNKSSVDLGEFYLAQSK